MRVPLLTIPVVLAGALCGQELISTQAPELTFTLPDKTEKLLSGYRGKVVSLEFIHTTCIHCQHASQTQKKLQSEYGERGFQAIDVAINQNADLLVENFAKDFGLNFPVGYTSTERAMAFLGFKPTDRYVVPQIVIIDRKGKIRACTTPKGDDEKKDAIRKEDDLIALVKQLMAEPVGKARRATKH